MIVVIKLWSGKTHYASRGEGLGEYILFCTDMYTHQPVVDVSDYSSGLPTCKNCIKRALKVARDDRLEVVT